MVDRRIQKTDAQLRQALAALIREKPYDEIVVKEILDRADVGRSTFYSHFRDKDALLLNGIRDLLGSAGPQHRSRDMLWFSLPIFEHIEGHRRAGVGGALMTPRGRRALHAHLPRAIIELTEYAVRTGLSARRRTGTPVSPTLLVRWIAATFVLVLDWWVECESPLPARDADRLFRGLVEPSLAELLK